MIEKGRVAEASDEFEEAFALFRRAEGVAPDARLRFHAIDSEATLLTRWTRTEPGRHPEALEASRRALAASEGVARNGFLRGFTIRLRELGEPVPPPDPPDDSPRPIDQWSACWTMVLCRFWFETQSQSVSVPRNS